MEIASFFKDLKVIELASVLAGPLAGSFFAEMGANVLKIENKNAGGDVTRSWKLPEEQGKHTPSAYYHSANFGKKVHFLDLGNVQDYNFLVNEIGSADMVLTNYQKATAHKLKIDIDTLRSIKPNICIVQLNAFEYDDPRPGYDLVMQAEAGYISMCGDGDVLAKMPVAMIDVLASHQIKAAALIALLHKSRTGQGSTMHVSLYKSALSGLVNQATNYLMEGHIAKPIGTRHPNIAPYGELVTSADGSRIMLSIGSDAQFSKFIQSLGGEVPSNFSTNVQRLANRTALLEFIQSLVATHDGQYLIQKLKANGIPYAFIKTIKDVFDEEASREVVYDNNIEGSTGKYVSGIAFQEKT